jgi:ferredoxin
MRVLVDYDSCDSNGLCAAAAPEIFEVRDDDFLYVLQENPPPHLWASAEAAARACPKLAVTLEDR